MVFENNWWVHHRTKTRPIPLWTRVRLLFVRSRVWTECGDGGPWSLIRSKTLDGVIYVLDVEKLE